LRTSELDSGIGKTTQESVNFPNKNPLSIFFKNLNLKGEKGKKL